jgi:hypothetical protein
MNREDPLIRFRIFGDDLIIWSRFTCRLPPAASRSLALRSRRLFRRSRRLRLLRIVTANYNRCIEQDE